MKEKRDWVHHVSSRNEFWENIYYKMNVHINDSMLLVVCSLRIMLMMVEEKKAMIDHWSNQQAQFHHHSEVWKRIEYQRLNWNEWIHWPIRFDLFAFIRWFGNSFIITGQIIDYWIIITNHRCFFFQYIRVLNDYHLRRCIRQEKKNLKRTRERERMCTKERRRCPSSFFSFSLSKSSKPVGSSSLSSHRHASCFCPIFSIHMYA